MITKQSVGQLLNSMSSNKGENVSKIINGKGEFINVFFAAESTVKVKSCKCSDISLFLLLFVKYEYPTIAMYAIIDGIINNKKEICYIIK